VVVVSRASEQSEVAAIIRRATDVSETIFPLSAFGIVAAQITEGIVATMHERIVARHDGGSANTGDTGFVQSTIGIVAAFGTISTTVRLRTCHQILDVARIHGIAT
jgi:hypothetical protein